jgi:predicted ATP-dependent serine protease
MGLGFTEDGEQYKVPPDTPAWFNCANCGKEVHISEWISLCNECGEEEETREATMTTETEKSPRRPVMRTEDIAAIVGWTFALAANVGAYGMGRWNISASLCAVCFGGLIFSSTAAVCAAIQRRIR